MENPKQLKLWVEKVSVPSEVGHALLLSVLGVDRSEEVAVTEGQPVKQPKPILFELLSQLNFVILKHSSLGQGFIGEEALEELASQTLQIKQQATQQAVLKLMLKDGSIGEVAYRYEISAPEESVGDKMAREIQQISHQHNKPDQQDPDYAVVEDAEEIQQDPRHPQQEQLVPDEANQQEVVHAQQQEEDEIENHVSISNRLQQPEISETILAKNKDRVPNSQQKYSEEQPNLKAPGQIEDQMDLKPQSPAEQTDLKASQLQNHTKQDQKLQKQQPKDNLYSTQRNKSHQLEQVPSPKVSKQSNIGKEFEVQINKIDIPQNNKICQDDIQSQKSARQGKAQTQHVQSDHHLNTQSSQQTDQLEQLTKTEQKNKLSNLHPKHSEAPRALNLHYNPLKLSQYEVQKCESHSANKENRQAAVVSLHLNKSIRSPNNISQHTKLPSLFNQAKPYGDKIFDNQSATTLQKSIVSYSMPKAERFKNPVKTKLFESTYYVGSCFKGEATKGTGFGYGTRKPYPQWLERNMKENPAPGAYDSEPSKYDKGRTFGISHRYYDKVLIPKQSNRRKLGRL